MIVKSIRTFAKVIIEWHSEDLSDVLLVSWHKVVVVTPLFKFFLNISSNFHIFTRLCPTCQHVELRICGNLLDLSVYYTLCNVLSVEWCVVRQKWGKTLE